MMLNSNLLECVNICLNAMMPLKMKYKSHEILPFMKLENFKSFIQQYMTTSMVYHDLENSALT